MKKILLSTLLAASVMFSADTNVCPDLSIKSDNLGQSQNIKSSMIKSHILSWYIYSDSIQAYNKSKVAVDSYVRDDILSSYSNTVMWSQLAKLKFAILDSNTDISTKNKLDIEYKNLLSKIDKQNPNWCNELPKVENKKAQDKTQSKDLTKSNPTLTTDYASAEKALQKTDRSRPSAALLPLNQK